MANSYTDKGNPVQRATMSDNAGGLVVRKVKKTLHFLENKPEVYQFQNITLPQITYAELLKEINQSCGVKPGDVKHVADTLLDRLLHYMEIGHPVSLGDFGSFKPDIRVKTTKREEDCDARTVKRRFVRFFPGKAFRNMMKEASITHAPEFDNFDNPQQRT